MLSPAAEARLSVELRSFHEKTGHQFVVAAFKSLDGESLEDWTNRLFRQWAIGDAKRNDGLLFCIFLDDRKWRVEVGYGLEGVLTDLQASRVARERGTPLFKAGDYDGGVLAVAEGLMAVVRGDAPAPAAEEPSEQRGGDMGALSLVVHVLFFFVLFILFIIPRRRRTYFGGGGWSSDWSGGGGGSDWGGGGGFSGGGGSSGGGGASGGW